jgi:hypothetical protein
MRRLPFPFARLGPFCLIRNPLPGRLQSWSVAMAVTLAVFLLATPVYAAPVTWDEYWLLARESREQLISLAGRPPADQAEELALLAKRWQEIETVTLPDGAPVTVDHTFLVALLQANPPDLTRLQALYTALLVEYETWPNGRHTAADLLVLAEILARAEFQWPDKQLNWWETTWERIMLRFLELVNRLAGNRLGSGIGARILTYGGAIALVVALFYAFRTIWGDLVREAELMPEAMAGDENLTADTAWKRAHELSSGGDYRTAVRYLYLSTLLLLDEQGLLRYDRSLTNREYLRTVAHLPELARTLREIIDVFDSVWYGFQPLDEAAFTRYAAQINALRLAQRG